MDRATAEAFYRRYLDRCNEHRFTELTEFVADPVQVNGAPQTVHQYGEGLAAVVRAVPDFHWTLEHLLVDGDWLSAHLTNTGTSVDQQEFALYHLADGRISEVWGTLDRDRLR
jgi:predicted ester cyclase